MTDRPALSQEQLARRTLLSVDDVSALLGNAMREDCQQHGAGGVAYCGKCGWVPSLLALCYSHEQLRASLSALKAEHERQEEALREALHEWRLLLDWARDDCDLAAAITNEDEAAYTRISAALAPPADAQEGK